MRNIWIYVMLVLISLSVIMLMTIAAIMIPYIYAELKEQK